MLPLGQSQVLQAAVQDGGDAVRPVHGSAGDLVEHGGGVVPAELDLPHGPVQHRADRVAHVPGEVAGVEPYLELLVELGGAFWGRDFVV